MYSTVRTAVLDGISAIPVQVEVDISTGMPVFDMVGNLTSEVREAKERVKTALHSVGIVLPAKRITVNLSPANIKKTGTGFDLPIAVAILTAMGVIDADSIKDCTLAGELNLNGEILPVSGILPIVFDEYNKGVGKFIIPKQNENEGRLVCGAKIFGISHLNDVIAQFDETAFTCQKTGMAHELQMDEKYADFCDVNGVVHNIVNAAEPGYSAADTGCKILVTGDIYTGSIRCCRAFTNGPEIESAIGAFEEDLNKYCDYDCGVNHKTVIKEHLLQSFGKRQPTENLCAEESAGSFNAYLTDTACKLVEGTSEEIRNARSENRKRQTRNVLIRAKGCCEKAEDESAYCCRCKGTYKRDHNQHERTRNFACCITGTFIEE